MYIIKLNNKKPTRKALTATFKTYDEAKNAIRRYLRSIDQYAGGFKTKGFSIEGVK